MPVDLDTIVSEILIEAGKGTGSRDVSSFIHLLTPGGARRVEAWTSQITNRNVRRLLERFWLGDRDAETVLFLKYLPITLPYLRSMNSKSKAGATTTVPDSPIPFTLSELKALAIDQDDVMQEAIVILLELLRSYKSNSKMSVASYLKEYFRRKFVEKTARTVLYRKDGKMTAKAKAFKNRDLAAVAEADRSAPITNFAEFLNHSQGAAYLMRDLQHYLKDLSPRGTRLYDWLIAANHRGWRVKMRIWTRGTAPPVPSHDSPPTGTLEFVVPRDALLDEYLRSPHAHRYVDRLKRGVLGEVQIKVFRKVYTTVESIGDQEIAQQLGVSRQRVQVARFGAAQRILQMAMDDHQAYLRKLEHTAQKIF
ncbi:MAG TPA: hypothetical protein VNT01_00625 [Symbiobacteriaceae bacterium]|nr:hypothetical protein [Symbiobacteriaceae bacterium]